MTRKITALLMAGLLTLAGCATPAATTTTAGTSAATTAAGTTATETTMAGTTTAGTTTASTTTAAKADLVVGMEANYAPYNWSQPTDANGAVPIDSSVGFAGGYDVEVAKLLAEALGRNLVIKQIAWEGLIPAVQNGGIDVIIAGMSVTPDRAESVDFSNPYYDSRFVMLVSKTGKFVGATKLADFTGAKIIGQKSTNYDAVIPQIPGVKHETPLGTVPLIINAIQKGVADGTVVEKPVAISVTAANPDLVMVEFTPENGFQEQEGIETALNIAMEKGKTELKDQVNAFLSTLTDDQRDALMETAVKNQP